MRSLPLLFATVLFSSALVAAEPPLPEGGRELLPAGTKPRIGIAAELGRAQVIETVAAPASPVLHVELRAVPRVPWNAQIALPIRGPIVKGDRCLLAFSMRALPGADGTPTRGELNANVQVNPANKKTVEQRYKPGPQWAAARLPFAAEFDIPDGSGVVNFFLGYQAQTLELCDVRLVNYGPAFDLTKLPRAPGETYEGRERDAPWRAAAEERIERLRKSELRVVVVVADGRPLHGAHVRVEMKRPAFGFGSAVAMRRLLEKSADGERYRAIIEECFPRVVMENDLKHDNWTAPADETKRAQHRARTLEALDWLNARGITVRGHFLAWCYAQPWSEALYEAKDAAAVRAAILSHMDGVLPAVGNRVVEWDALNHPVAFGQSLRDLAGPSIYADLMAEARARTRLPLAVNEDLYDRWRQDGYFEVVRDLKERGQAPDIVGNMAHFHAGTLMGIPEWLAMSDRFASLVPNLAVTEYDLDTPDDALHADYLRDLLTATFSHPAYSEFVMWGFWEGMHWRPAAALWRADWSERPAARVWRELVLEKWRTRGDGTTGSDGAWTLRAFQGDYEITAAADGKSATVRAALPNGGAEVKVALP